MEQLQRCKSLLFEDFLCWNSAGSRLFGHWPWSNLRWPWKVDVNEINIMHTIYRHMMCIQWDLRCNLQAKQCLVCLQALASCKISPWHNLDFLFIWKPSGHFHLLSVLGKRSDSQRKRWKYSIQRRLSACHAVPPCLNCHSSWAAKSGILGSKTILYWFCSHYDISGF